MSNLYCSDRVHHSLFKRASFIARTSQTTTAVDEGGEEVKKFAIAAGLIDTGTLKNVKRRGKKEKEKERNSKRKRERM